MQAVQRVVQDNPQMVSALNSLPNKVVVAEESVPPSPLLHTHKNSILMSEDPKLERSIGYEPTAISLSRSVCGVTPVKSNSLLSLPSHKQNTSNILKMVATYALHLYLVYLERKQHILIHEDGMRHAVASAVIKLQGSPKYKENLKSLSPEPLQFRRDFNIAKGVPEYSTNAELILKQWRKDQTGSRALLIQKTINECQEMFSNSENSAKEVTKRSLTLKSTKVSKKASKVLRMLKKLLLKYSKYGYPIEDMLTTKPFPTKPYER